MLCDWAHARRVGIAYVTIVWCWFYSKCKQFEAIHGSEILTKSTGCPLSKGQLPGGFTTFTRALHKACGYTCITMLPKSSIHD